MNVKFINKKFLILGFFILIVLTCISVLNLRKVKYITKPIVKETITQYVEASGTIKPINTIAVGTQATHPLKIWYRGSSA